MKRFVKYLIVGALLITCKNIDFMTGVFMLHGEAMMAQLEFFLLVFIVFLGVAAICLPLQHSVGLVFCLSICFAVQSLVWFVVGNVIFAGNILAIQEAPQYIMRGVEYCVDQWDKGAGVDFLTAFWLAFISGSVVMGLILMTRKLTRKKYI